MLARAKQLNYSPGGPFRYPKLTKIPHGEQSLVATTKHNVIIDYWSSWCREVNLCHPKRSWEDKSETPVSVAGKIMKVQMGLLLPEISSPNLRRVKVHIKQLTI